jgi:hypothetical protein
MRTAGITASRVAVIFWVGIFLSVGFFMRRESKRNRVYHGGFINANRGRGCSIGTTRRKYAPAAIARAAITARILECIVLYRRDRRTRASWNTEKQRIGSTSRTGIDHVAN